MKKTVLCLAMFLSTVSFAEMVDLGTYWPLAVELGDNSGAPAFSNLLIDAANEKTSIIFYVPGTYVFRRFGFFFAAITTGSTNDVRLETIENVSPAGLTPTGTLVCANSSTTIVTTNTSDNSYIETGNLPSDCSVTGTTVAVVFVGDGTFSGNLKSWTNSRQDFTVSYTSNSSAGYGGNATILSMTMTGSDSQFISIPSVMTVSTITTTNFNSGSSPNVRGNYIDLPFRHRVVGAYLQHNLGGNALIELSTDGVTALTSISISSNTKNGFTPVLRGFIRFPTPQIMAANIPYRLTIRPETTSNIAVYTFQYETSIMEQLTPFGDFIHQTSATSPTQESDWTQTTNAQTRIFPLIDQIDVNATKITPFIQ